MRKLLMMVVLIGGGLLWTVLAEKRLESQVAGGSESETLLRTLPKAAFSDFEGKDLPMSADGSRAILVHFWATWCGPCEAELPELLKLVSELPNREKLEVWLVAVNDEVPKIKKQLAALPPTDAALIHWVLDNQAVHRDAYGTSKLPETYLFKADGLLLRKFVGPQEWGKPLFLDILGPLLR